MTPSTPAHRPHVLFWLVTGAAVLAFLFVFRDILLPFVTGVAFAYFINPIVDACERRGLPRLIAAVVVVGLALVAIVVAAVVLGPMLAAQAKQLAAALPGEAERLRTVVEQAARERLGTHYPNVEAAIARGLADLQASSAGAIGQVLTRILVGGSALMNLVSLLLITPLVTFYLVVDWHRMLAAMETWLPRDHRATIIHLAHDIDGAVSAFIRGQGTICLVLGAFYAVGLSLVGLRYGLAIGLATGLLGFIPVAGWMLGFIVALGLAIAQFGFALPVALVALVMLAGMVLDTAILSPKLVGTKVGLHPVWLIFSLFAFSYLLGFVGTLVAVPLAAATVVLVRHGLKLYKQSDVYLGAGTPREPM